MEPQDPTENPFAPEYPHLQDWVTEAEAQLQQLNQEMERTGVAPRLELRPPNPMGGNQTVQVRRSRADIQHDKDEKKATVYKRIEKETEKAEPNLKKRMQDIAFGHLYREEIERFKNPERGLMSPTASWSLNDVQIKAMAFAKASRDEKRRQPQRQVPERTVIVLPVPAEATLPGASADAALPASAEPKQLEAPADVSQGASEPDAPQEPDMEPEP